MSIVKVETQADLEAELSIEDLERVISEGNAAHSELMQVIGMNVSQASDISHAIGRYTQMLADKRSLQQESDDATKH